MFLVVTCIDGLSVTSCTFCFSPNFLILDEPTNHLDMETIEALGNAILKFQVQLKSSI